MAVIGERQVAGGNGKNPSGLKAGDAVDMEGFWRCDKFRIRAVIRNLFAFQANQLSLQKTIDLLPPDP